MSQIDDVVAVERNWWERVTSPLLGQAEEKMKYELPADSLFAGSWDAAPATVADVPDGVKAQIRQEAVLDAINQLEASLRLLLHATVPGKEPPTAEQCQKILNVWRYELEHRIHLTPDTYCGAVRRYEPDMEKAYAVEGRCGPGDVLRIRVPCWRMFDQVVIRGEAEVVDESELTAPQPEPQAV